jgi:hypothetical protein
MFTNVVLNVTLCKRITFILKQNFDGYVLKINCQLLNLTWFTSLKGKEKYFEGCRISLFSRIVAFVSKPHTT